jgi:hypothetical protein
MIIERSPMPGHPWFMRLSAWITAVPTMNALLAPCVIWFVGGLYLDGWAHNHGKVDNTFFTPWHAVFYSGYLAVAGMLAIFVLAHLYRGIVWQTALPTAYRTAIIAAPLFAVGGVADLWWHTTFGFEAGIEPLVSPPHLLLAASMTFMCIAIARTASTTPERIGRQIPVVLSLLAGWAVITFMLQFSHPFGIVWPERNPIGQNSVLNGIPGILIHASITSIVGVWMLTRNLTRGSFTVVITLNALMIALMGDEYRFAWAALGVGIISEAGDYVLRHRPQAWRVMLRASIIGISFPLLYMAVIAQTSILYWGIDAIMSSVMLTTALCLASVWFIRPSLLSNNQPN